MLPDKVFDNEILSQSQPIYQKLWHSTILTSPEVSSYKKELPYLLHVHYSLTNIIPIFLKGLTMIFAGHKKPLIHLRSKEIYIYFKTNKNPHKLAEIMKKSRVFGKFHSWGHSNSVYNKFPKILVLLCVVHLKEKKMISENWKK